MNLQRLHLGGAAGLAAALHHGRHLVVDPHERERARRLAATGELLALTAKRGEVGAGARAELEQHGLAASEIHDVFHVVLDALDEAGAALWIFVGIVGHHHVVLRLIPPPVARRSLHAVLVIEPDVEPDRRVERTMLVDAEPGKVAVEVLAVLLGLEIAVGGAPVGDRAGDAMHELLDGVLPLGSVDLAVEVLANDHVGGQLAPGGGNLAGRLLEEHLAVLPLDRGRPQLPLRRVKRTLRLDRAEGGMDVERRPSGASRSGGRGGGGGRRAGQRCGGVESCHEWRLLGVRGRPTGARQDRAVMCRSDVSGEESILPYSSSTNRHRSPAGPIMNRSAGPTGPLGAMFEKQFHLHAIARCSGGRFHDPFLWAGA